MRKGRRRMLWLLPTGLVLGLAALAVLLLWAADYWIESSGGRRMVEQRLGEQLGMPVTLEGEFGVRLLPRLAVSGSDLMIGGPGAEQRFVRAGHYEVSIALRPLLRREVIIERLRLEQGALFPANYAGGGEEQAAPDGQQELPELSRLVVRDFELVFAEDARITIEKAVLSDFSQGQPAPFSLEIRGYGHIEGDLHWNASPARIGLAALWASPWGELEFDGSWSQASSGGDFSAVARLPERAAPLELQARYELHGAGVLLPEVSVATAGQSARGWACLLTASPLSAQMALTADRLELDAVFPARDGGEATAGFAALPDEFQWAPPLGVDARLGVDELRAAGAVARGAVLSLGGEPDCSAFDGATNP